MSSTFGGCGCYAMQMIGRCSNYGMHRIGINRFAICRTSIPCSTMYYAVSRMLREQVNLGKLVRARQMSCRGRSKSWRIISRVVDADPRGVHSPIGATRFLDAPLLGRRRRRYCFLYHLFRVLRVRITLAVNSPSSCACWGTE